MKEGYRIIAALLVLVLSTTALLFLIQERERKKEATAETVVITEKALVPIEPAGEDASQPREEPQQQSGIGVLFCSNLTAEELASGLYEPLKQYAECFIQAEKQTGVNAIFLASIAALESGWAKSEVAQNKNNLFGWTSKSGYRSFGSKEECIAFVAEQLKALYLSPEGIYFNGYDVSDVNVRYNGRESWEDTVTQIMGEITHRINEAKEG
jgi:hypothetical protein